MASKSDPRGAASTLQKVNEGSGQEAQPGEDVTQAGVNQSADGAPQH